MNTKTFVLLRPNPFETFFQKEKEGYETVSLCYDLPTPIKKYLSLSLKKNNCLVYLKESLLTSSAEKLRKKYEKNKTPEFITQQV